MLPNRYFCGVDMVAQRFMHGDGRRESLNVMVSDVRDQFADALQVLLEPHGFTIRRVESGDEAIWLVQHEPVDAAVLDQDLPDMPGVAAMRMIRTLDRLMPIILVGRSAGSADQQTLLRSALELEAFSVMAQPVDLEVMLGQMARVFQRFIRGVEAEWSARDEPDMDIEQTREPHRRGPGDDTLRFRSPPRGGAD